MSKIEPKLKPSPDPPLPPLHLSGQQHLEVNRKS